METFFADFIILFDDVLAIFKGLKDTAVFWMPIVLGSIFASVWMRMIRAHFINNIDFVLLEIKLPRDLKKTPLAMEIALNGFYQKAQGKWPDWVFLGKVRNWFSLEMVSIEGDVHFFVRVNRSLHKDIIEAQLYAQYPNIEIVEVPDYTRYVDFKTGKDSEWDLWGLEYGLSKEDAYPIKTYVDFGMDREGIKDEEKVDPMTGTIEMLGAVGKNQQMWIQILIQPTKKRFHKEGTLFGKTDWKESGERIIRKISENRRVISSIEGAGNIITDVSDPAKATTKAIARSISKLGFDCGIRGVYLAKKGTFNPSNIFALLGAFRQYSTNDLNSIEDKRPTSFLYPWEDFFEIRENPRRRRMFNAYKQRSWFYAPYKRKPFVLNTEELATIFHLPGAVAETPTFGRIDSRKSEPPTNLPL